MDSDSFAHADEQQQPLQRDLLRGPLRDSQQDSQEAQQESPHPLEPLPKRRKIRKGTHTCWECKRRKVRCTFASPGDTTCIGCTKRCLRCVSQEFPEETTTAAAKSRLVGDRIERVEEMIMLLTQQKSQGQPLNGSMTNSLACSLAGSPLAGLPLDPAAEHPDLTTNTTTTTTSSVAECRNQTEAPSFVAGIPTPASCVSPADSFMVSSVSTPATHPQSSRIAAAQSAEAAMLISLPTFGSMSSPQMHLKLTEALLEVFPSQHDLNIIATHGTMGFNHCQAMFRSQREIIEQGFWSASILAERPSAAPDPAMGGRPVTHPVLLARRMLVIAAVLQLCDPTTRRRLEALQEPAHKIAARLAERAIQLVTHNDEMLDTLEGLECVMLEAIYCANSGQLRRSWLTWRRGLSLAQLMRIPRRNAGYCSSRPGGMGGNGCPHVTGVPNNAGRGQPVDSGMSGYSGIDAEASKPPRTYDLDPQFLWYRLLTTERFLCLLLGLPQATAEVSLPSAESIGCDTPLALMEHHLARIAGFVLDRNERGPRPDDYAATQRVDKEMRDIAAAMPSRWWLPPNLMSLTATDVVCIWDMMRLLCQIIYYHVLNQLHLPYMMPPSFSSSDRDSDKLSDKDSRRYEYSRMACVSASRESLYRYNILRNFNQVACCCRHAEFFALTASLTLLLVHIDGNRAAAEAEDELLMAEKEGPDTESSSETLPPGPMGESNLNGQGGRSNPRRSRRSTNAHASFPNSNLLTHQRLSDRAMIEEVLESMKVVARINEDVVSESSVDLLGQLLVIEADTAAGGARAASRDKNNRPGGAGGAGSASTADDLLMSVPFVGIITISHNGHITKQAHPRMTPSLSHTYSNLSCSSGFSEPSAGSNDGRDSLPAAPSAAPVTASTSGAAASVPSAAPATMNPPVSYPFTPRFMPNAFPITSSSGNRAAAPTTSATAAAALPATTGIVQGPQLPTPPAAPFANLPPSSANHDNVVYPQNLYPAAAGGIDQWAFQGVDMAFFDNLMRETAFDPGKVANNTWL